MMLHLRKSLETQSLRVILNVAFALIFIIPLLIFFYNVLYFDLLDHLIIKFSFVAFLTFSLLGFILLRQVVDRIIALSSTAEAIPEISPLPESLREQNELKKIAVTFQNLVHRLETTTADLEKRAAELSTLKDLTDISSKITDFNQLFSVVLEKVMVTTDSEYGMMLSTSENGKKLRIVAARGVEESKILNREFDTETTISGRVIAENKTLVTGDISLESGFNSVVDGMFSGPFIAKAITARGRTIGILNLSRGKNGKQFSAPELDYLSTALGQVAFAFDNAELIRELKDSYAELKEMQSLLLRFERTTAINQTVVTLSDRINNPLMVIQGHAELLRQKLDAGDEKIQYSLDIIQNSIHACSEIMSRLREIQEPIAVKYTGTGYTMIDIEASEKPNPAAGTEEQSC